MYEPMKAKTSDVLFLERVSNDARWGAGEKFDGYREVLYLGKRSNEMLSSLGNSHIAKCPQFQVVLPELSDTVLDCEGLSPTRRLEDNASCFKADAPNAIAWQKKYGEATLVVFDILQFCGRDVTKEQFIDRIPLLTRVMARLSHVIPVKQEVLIYRKKSDYYNKIIARTQMEGHEGIILKDLYAPYTSGKRTNAWLKVKRIEHLQYLIKGFIPGCGKYDGQVGAIVYGTTNRDIGTSSGMDDNVRDDMTQHPKNYIGHKAHFECQEVTSNGVMRHPRYKGLVEGEVK